MSEQNHGVPRCMGTSLLASYPMLQSKAPLECKRQNVSRCRSWCTILRRAQFVSCRLRSCGQARRHHLRSSGQATCNQLDFGTVRRLLSPRKSECERVLSVLNVSLSQAASTIRPENVFAPEMSVEAQLTGPECFSQNSIFWSQKFARWNSSKVQILPPPNSKLTHLVECDRIELDMSAGSL